ncbi:MAG: hypothetical protein LCH32_05380 [Bacteroidetes bacterium]|nr:hypothetical protein [Bacteroidota bacterium]
MKNKLLHIFLLLFCSAFIQNNSFKIIQKHQSFKVDNLGNIYFVNNDEVIKYNQQGKLINRYSNLQLGNITTLDVTNPLKMIVYYKDFQQIVFIDNQLSTNSDIINLEELGFEQTDLVCTSVNNSFWIFDKRNSELIRFNEQSKIVNRTGNLNLIFNKKITPNYLVEQNGYVYLNCFDSGINVFDIYGTFSKTIGIKSLTQFQISNEFLLYQKDSVLISYNTKLFNETQQKFNKIPTQVQYKNGLQYLGFNDTLLVKPI